MDSLVSYHPEGGIATLRMDDGKANVMGLPMQQALNEALDRAEAEEAVVVLAGRPGMFSGGFDLAVFKGPAEPQRRMLEGGARLAARLLAHPQPVLAQCTGHAIAMGAFLLLASDQRVGVDDAACRIQLIEVQIGMTLPRFAIEVSRQRLAPAHLALAAITSYPYGPAQACAAGFLDETVPAAALEERTRAQAKRLRALHAGAFRATKQRMRHDTLQALGRAIDADVAEWQQRIVRPAA